VHDASVAAQLAAGAAQLELALPPRAQSRMLAYLELLQKWNRTYNLTAVRTPAKMVSHHLLDALAVVPHVKAAAVLDVGSGAGIPGIPLALALPHSHVTLLDASQKKTAFLLQAKLELELDNVAVACARAEDWHPGRTFEIVISRAFADVAKFAAVAGRHLGLGGRLAAMKGALAREELARIPAGWKLEQAIALAVPGLRAQRHLVLLGAA
jgi:16S rRNA (guanine527-N7)-methyltransferase